MGCARRPIDVERGGPLTVADSVDVKGPRDLRTRDFATATLDVAERSEDDLLPNRAYPSNLLWRMTGALDASAAPARILDLGPTNNENIQFWARRGFGVSCFDLFTREARRLGPLEITPLTLSTDTLRQQRLPFEDGSYSAICSWNVLSRLPFVLARQFARECHRLLCRSGLMHAVFLDSDGRLDTRRQYQIVDRQSLQVTSAAVPRRLPTNWVDAEIRLMLSRFAACEIQAAPSYTREVLAQRAPIRPTARQPEP